MRKILENIDKEIKCIEEQGITQSNIDNLFKLVDIKKDISTINAMEEEASLRYDNYEPMSYRGDYGMNGSRYVHGGRGGRYRGDDRLSERMDRVAEGMDRYQYGRNRYMDGDNSKRMEEGLEELMYAICSLMDSIIDFAETPEEKEIVRKHIQKMKSI